MTRAGSRGVSREGRWKGTCWPLASYRCAEGETELAQPRNVVRIPLPEQRRRDSPRSASPQQSHLAQGVRAQELARTLARRQGGAPLLLCGQKAYTSVHEGGPSAAITPGPMSTYLKTGHGSGAARCVLNHHTERDILSSAPKRFY